MPSHNKLTHASYLSLVGPFVFSTITTPLMGAVDTAVVGRLPNASYLGGVAIGAVIFSTLYWLFGFLRVSTSGFAAQAAGALDEEAALWAFLRPLSMAIFIGALFVLLQDFILQGALRLTAPALDVAEQVSVYFRILIWGAPFLLSYYVLLGWLMGMVRMKEVLLLQVVANVLNMALAVLLVQGAGWGVAGAAWATLTAQIMSALAAGVFVWRHSRLRECKICWRNLWDAQALRQMVSVNGDLMLRTICLLAMTNLFTRTGASFGTEMLAANAVLFQIQYIMAYFFDGFANASSVWSGKAKGSGDISAFKKLLCLSGQWSFLAALLLGGLYWRGGEWILPWFTEIPEVIVLSRTYSAWLVLFPFAAAVGLVFYGVFTGASWTGPVRNSTIGALLVFVSAHEVLVPLYGNHGLWGSFLLFTAGRSVFLLPYAVKAWYKPFVA